MSIELKSAAQPRAEEVNLNSEQAISLAYQMVKNKMLPEAESIIRRVLVIEPNNVNALNGLGHILANNKRYYEALYRFDRALRVEPDNLVVLGNRATILGELGHPEEALDVFLRLIELNPEEAVYHSNVANTLDRLRRPDEALHFINKAIQLSPRDKFHYDRGIILYNLGRDKEAIEELDRMLGIDPDHFDARYNRGLARLRTGDFGGFADYEARLRTAEGPYYIGPFKQPMWNGTDSLDGKTILVHSEQGIGDSIQFLRFIPKLKAMGANVVLVVFRPLVDIARSLGVQVLQSGDQFPDFDCWLPLLSLGSIFVREEADIPAPLKIDVSQAFRSDVDAVANGKKKIGVCWSGNWQHKNDVNRSIPLSVFKRVFDIKDAKFFSLQKEVRADDAAAFADSGLVDFTQLFSTMLETASFIRSLDEVLTVDTAVAHLAATMGVNTSILIPSKGTDWRWQSDRIDSPWYPAATLWRKQPWITWEQVLDSWRGPLS